MTNEYPEHEKMQSVRDDAQIVGEFIEFLEGEKDIDIPEKYLYEFFDIDFDKIEAEKEAMLDSMS